jgi:ribosomal protein S14
MKKEAELHAEEDKKTQGADRSAQHGRQRGLYRQRRPYATTRQDQRDIKKEVNEQVAKVREVMNTEKHRRHPQ